MGHSVAVSEECRRYQVDQGEPQRPPSSRVHVSAVTIVAVAGVVVAVLGHPVPSLAAAVITTALSRLMLGVPPNADLPLELTRRFIASAAGFRRPRRKKGRTRQSQVGLPPVTRSRHSRLRDGHLPGGKDH